MKNVILAVMAVLTLAGPASATSDWDYFWGTTLNPQNTGWDDFWYQCQDPDKGLGDCVGTVAAGIGAAITIPLAAAGIIAASAGIVAAGATTAVVTVPTTSIYLLTSTGLVTMAPWAGAGFTALTPVAMTASGGFVYAM